MNDQFWDEDDIYDDEDALTKPDKKEKARGSERKRKWREIELIKEQRRLRRDIAEYEQYSF